MTGRYLTQIKLLLNFSTGQKVNRWLLNATGLLTFFPAWIFIMKSKLIAMPSHTPANQDFVKENATPMNTVLKNSYDSAKKHIQGSVNVIQGGITVIKDEFIGIYDRAATMVNKMALPVNNFIKDLTQIDAEFQAETAAKSFTPSTSGCTLIPLEEALKGRMEENY